LLVRDAGHELAVAGLRAVGERLRGDLRFGHLQRDERGRDALVAADVAEDLAGERGLAAPGLAGDDDQLALLDAARGVEEREAGLDTAGSGGDLPEGLDRLVGGLREGDAVLRGVGIVAFELPHEVGLDHVGRLVVEAAGRRA